MPAKSLNRDELLRLPAVVSVPVAARALGLGRNKAYELVKNDQFPCAVLCIGNTYRVPTADLLRILGMHHTGDDGRHPNDRTGQSHDDQHSGYSPRASPLSQRASGSPHAGR
jgi:hypothetical protein